MARRPSQPGERTVCRFMSSVSATGKWIWGLVVICAGVNATFLMFPRSITFRNKNPVIYFRELCMDSASCRYSTTAATVQFLRQSRLFLTTDCLGGTLQSLPKREMKLNLSLPVICNNFDATATDTLTPHFSEYRVSRRRRPRPGSMRCILLLWAASVCDGPCPTPDDAAVLPPTEVPAHPYPDSPLFTLPLVPIAGTVRNPGLP